MTIIEKAKKDASSIREESNRVLQAILEFQSLVAPAIETPEEQEAANILIDAISELHGLALKYADSVEALYEDMNMQIKKRIARRN